MAVHVPIDLLRQVLRYEPETGKLFWRPRSAALIGGEGIIAKMNYASFNQRFAGKECFRLVSHDGYLHGTLFNWKYPAHQVIWALVHGVWSTKEMQVDHINGNRADNRLANLRLVPEIVNLRSRVRRAYKHGGEKGIALNQSNMKWQVTVPLGGGRNRYIGCYEQIETARIARDAAEKALKGVL